MPVSKHDLKRPYKLKLLGFVSPVLHFYVLTFLLQIKTKQYITAIYNIETEILYFQCLNCLQTWLFCKSIIPEDSGSYRRALSNASVKTRFKAILKLKMLGFASQFYVFTFLRSYSKTIRLPKIHNN